MKGRTQDAPTEVTLPITPMLDMAFQLMFFFLATFNPVTAKEGQLDLSLPAKSDTAAKSPDQVSPMSEAHKEDIDDQANLTVALRGQRDPRLRGQVSSVTLTTNAGPEELSGTPERREKLLLSKLEAAKPGAAGDGDKKKGGSTVRIEAESDLRWSEVVKVMDISYKAGFQVSFAKPPDLGASP
jgi:biopolymer transport protein ExbD